MTSWLINEFEKLLQSCKDVLPYKAVKEGFLHVLWIEPPMHKNFGDINNNMRLCQRDCLHEIVQVKTNMSSLKMLKHWDHDDGGAFLKDRNRFTSDGLDRYWDSIDSAIRYWDKNVLPRMQERKRKQHKLACNANYRNRNPQFIQDKFHWNRQYRLTQAHSPNAEFR